MAQWVKLWSTKLAVWVWFLFVEKFFLSVDSVLFHTAFQYLPSISSVWLKNYWKGHKIKLSSIHPCFNGINFQNILNSRVNCITTFTCSENGRSVALVIGYTMFFFAIFFQRETTFLIPVCFPGMMKSSKIESTLTGKTLHLRCIFSTLRLYRY